MFVADLHQFLCELVRNKFYGSVEIRFEAGHVSVIRKVESFKVPEDEPCKFREVSNDHSR